MAIAYVRDTGKQQGVNVATDAGSFASLPSVGNAIIVCISGWQTSGFTMPSTGVTDNQGNSYVEVIEASAAHNASASIFACYNVATSAGTFTITVDPTPASGNYIEWVGTEVSGLIASSSALDKTLATSSTSSSGDAATGNTSATAQANEIVFACLTLVNNDSTLNITNPTSGYTQLSVMQNAVTTIGHQAAYKIVSATGAQSATWTHDNTSQAGWSTVIATFKEAAAAGGAAPKFMHYQRQSRLWVPEKPKLIKRGWEPFMDLKRAA